VGKVLPPTEKKLIGDKNVAGILLFARG